MTARVSRIFLEYNIFVATNISKDNSPETRISDLFSIIGQPARIQILIAISTQEACVCHLEAALHMRQASISQHLMVLRKAGLVTTQRDGRNIFYRLTQPEVVDLLYQAAHFSGISQQELVHLSLRPVAGCCCPQCNPDMDPRLTCRPVKVPE
jgi:ArsR family transcriptional regulator